MQRKSEEPQDKDKNDEIDQTRNPKPVNAYKMSLGDDNQVNN
jgi:hypothetical protein